MDRAMNRAEWALLAALSLAWAATFLFIELALRGLGPLTIVLGRVGLGACALLLAARLMGHAMPRGLGIWGAFLVMGALNNAIPFGLIAWAQTRIDSGLARISQTLQVHRGPDSEKVVL
jgi:drug/metabolite transporter (DMT)-like permease